MNARQFFDKVALMRKLQKEYFRTRSKTALNQSKAVEREVDAEIARVHDALGTPATKQPEQRNIFEEDGVISKPAVPAKVIRRGRFGSEYARIRCDAITIKADSR